MVLSRFTLISGVFLFFLFASCSADPEVKTLEEDGGEVPANKAKSLYTMHCATCHGDDGKLGLSNAKDLSVSKLDEKQVKEVILNGNDKGMMPYRDIITSDREVDAVVKYVQGLRK